MDTKRGDLPSEASPQNVGQQVVDEHLRNLRHHLPDERVSAWSEQRFAEARAFGHVPKSLEARQRSIDNEIRQAEISRQRKELKLRMSKQKVLFKEQIEREAKERREQERLAKLERERMALLSEAYTQNGVPPPPPLPFSVMPDLCVWIEQHNSQPIVYYDFARPGDARVVFKPRKP